MKAGRPSIPIHTFKRAVPYRPTKPPFILRSNDAFRNYSVHLSTNPMSPNGQLLSECMNEC